jgi:hypothetical protein
MRAEHILAQLAACDRPTIVHALWGGAPGCPIADPDYCEGERS